MRPCVGLNGLCPPLCTWSQLRDGSVTLADVERFNQALTEMHDNWEANKPK
ncbi:tetracycline resistance leader peptide [Phage vB_KsaM-C1]|nr:tetracycline resistance leader peptide [Phage vB_KsaM-C1]